MKSDIEVSPITGLGRNSHKLRRRENWQKMKSIHRKGSKKEVKKAC